MAPKTIKEYIKSESTNTQKALRKMYGILKKAAPKAGEKIAWGMPTLTLDGNLLHFAAFKNHLSLFPGSDAILHFQGQLGKFVTSKGTIQFPYENALPSGLITKITKYCIKRNGLRAKARGKLKSKSKSKQRY